MRKKLKVAKQTALIICFAIAVIHIVHGLTLDRTMQYLEVDFCSPALPAGLDGLRVAFITDTHEISQSRLWEVVDELNRRSLDLLLLGGDFSSNAAHMHATLAVLSQVKTTQGIFGVEGNHDSHLLLFAAMQEHGMTALSNSGVEVYPGFYLAGLEDLQNRNPCIATAVSGATQGDFVLLLTHNPDVTMRQDTTGVDLVLAGHSHGGQITFFGVWAPYLTFTRHVTRYGQRFRSGWAQSRDGVPVFVSSGTGQYLPRIFARPQVIILTLRHS